jgi:hypothetical protein
MLAIHIDGVLRHGEVFVRKCADGDGIKRAIGQRMIPERRAASGAEMKVRAGPAAEDMGVDIMRAAGSHRLCRKARLHGKGRAAAFLAIIAMADRNADRLAGAGDRELAAAAGGGSGGVGVIDHLNEGHLTAPQNRRDSTKAETVLCHRLLSPALANHPY